jgi:hypothetical protein
MAELGKLFRVLSLSHSSIESTSYDTGVPNQAVKLSSEALRITFDNAAKLQHVKYLFQSDQMQSAKNYYISTVQATAGNISQYVLRKENSLNFPQRTDNQCCRHDYVTALEHAVHHYLAGFHEDAEQRQYQQRCVDAAGWVAAALQRVPNNHTLLFLNGFVLGR